MKLENHLVRKSVRIVYAGVNPEVQPDVEVTLEEAEYDDIVSRGENGEFDRWVMLDGFNEELG